MKRSILSPEELQKLKEHKYSVDNLSLTEPYLQTFWCWVISLVPLWVAPNLITIVGLCINVATTLVLVFCCPTATERAPWWATGGAAIGLFLYQTLDAIDGKQARRTGTSGPLGELFDHGCDSASTVFVSLCACCSVRLGLFQGWLIFQCLMASTLFYSAHWQTYVSGTMQFSWIDVTEGQFVVMAVMLVSAAEDVIGLDIWHSQLPGAPAGTTVLNVYLVLGVAMALNHMRTTLPLCVVSRREDGRTIAGTSVFSPLAPLLVLLLSAVALATLAQDELFSGNPILYCLLMGLIGSKITNRLIVAHMCKGPVQQLDSSMAALLAMGGNQLLGNIVRERTMLLFALVYVTFDLLWYCAGVCSQICQDFKINTFSIPYSKQDNKKK